MKKLIDAKSEKLRERYQQQYSETDRQVKRLTRADRRSYTNGLAAEAEDASKRNQQGTVYKITRLIYGQHQANANTIIKDKQGSLLATEQEERWTEYFREILNIPPPEEDADISGAVDDLDINAVVTEKEEIIS